MFEFKLKMDLSLSPCLRTVRCRPSSALSLKTSAQTSASKSRGTPLMDSF